MRLTILLTALLALPFASVESAEADSISRKQREARLAARRRPAATTLQRACPAGISRIGRGVLWKPEADSSDSRRGKPVVLLTGSYKTRTNTVKIFGTGGQTLCTFSFKAPIVPGTNGGADHYWSGWPGGCGKTASQISRMRGGSSVYVQWKNRKCLGPINPRARTGSI